MPLRLRYWFPKLDALEVRPLPVEPPLTPEARLRRQLALPESLEQARRVRPDLGQLDDLSLVEALVQETQGRKPLEALEAPPAPPPSPPALKQARFEDLDPLEGLLRPQRPNPLSDVFTEPGAPLPRVRQDPEDALRPMPLGERGPLPQAFGEAPEPTAADLRAWAAQQGIEPAAEPRDTLAPDPELALPTRVDWQKDLGPVERDLLGHFPEDLQEEAAQRLASLRRPGRMGPDEYGRFIEDQIQYFEELSLGDPAFRFLPHEAQDVLADMEAKGRLSRQVLGPKDPDIEPLLEGVPEAQAQEIRRLFKPSVTDLPGEADLLSVPEGAPGGRRAVERPQPNLAVITPKGRKAPLAPGAADPEFAARTQAFSKEAHGVIQALDDLQRQENRLLRYRKGKGTVKRQDQPAAELRRIRKQRAQLEARLKALQEPLEEVRASAQVTPRELSDPLDVVRSGPQPGEPTPFPFTVGSKVGDRSGRTGIIEGIVPQERVVATPEELRRWAEAGERSPTYFNAPLALERRPTAGTGVTQAFQKKDFRTGETRTTLWQKRTLEAPPVVRVRWDDTGEVGNVPGSSLLPAAKAPLEAIKATLQATQQPSFDWETGGSAEARVAQQLRAQLAKLPGKTAKGWKLLSRKVDAEGKLLVQREGAPRPQRLTLEAARKLGILPPDEPVGVDTGAPPQIDYLQGRKKIPGGVKGKSFPGLLRQGQEVDTPEGRQRIERIEPQADGTLEILLKALGLGGLGAALGQKEDTTEEPPAVLGAGPGAVLDAIIRRIVGGRNIPHTNPDRVMTEQIRPVQEAPRIEEPSKAPLGTRAEQFLANDKALRTGLGKFLEKEGLISAEESPYFLEQGIKEGGGYVEDAALGRLRDLVASSKDAGDMALLKEILNYRGMLGGLEQLKKERDIYRSKAMELYAKGLETEAKAMLAKATPIEEALAQKKALPGGYDEAGLQSSLAALERQDPDRFRLVNAVADDVLTVPRETLQLAVQEGIISPEWADFYKGRRGDYVPLTRVMDRYDPVLGQRFSKPKDLRPGDPQGSSRMNFTTEQELSQQLRGSERLLENPLGAIGHYVQGVSREVLRNRGAKANLLLAEKWGQDPKVKAKFQDLYGVKRLAGDPPPGAPPAGKDYVGFMEKGKTIWFEADQEFAGALKAWDPTVQSQLLGKPFGAVARAWKSMVTTLFPGFIAMQIPKDFLATPLNVDFNKYSAPGVKRGAASKAFRVPVKSYAQYTGYTLGHILGSYVQNIAGAAARLTGGHEAELDTRQLTGKALAKVLPFHEEFVSGPAASRPFAAPVNPLQEIEGLPAAMRQETGLVGKAATAYDAALGTVTKYMLQPFELGYKYGAYAAARKAHYGPVEAAWTARVNAGTPEFVQRGRILTEQTPVGKLANLVMFISPAIQGVNRLVQGAATHPDSYVKGALFTGVALMAAQGWNAQFKEPDGTPSMERIPRDVLETSIPILLPQDISPADLPPGLDPHIRSTGAWRYTTLKVPLPQELQIILQPFWSAYFATRPDPLETYSAGQGVADVVNTMLPGGGSIDVNQPLSILDRVTASLHPALRWSMETAANRVGYTGVPIVGSRIEGNMPEYQKTLRTMPFFSALGRRTGLSPDRLQHFAQAFGGPTAEVLAGAAAPLITEPQDDPLKAIRTGAEARAAQGGSGPIARRFFDSGVSDQKLADLRNFFYSNLEEASQGATTLGALAGRQPENLRRFMGDHPEAVTMRGVNPALTNIQRTLSQLDKVKEVIIRDPEMDPAEKQRRLRRYYLAEEKLLTQGATFIQRLKAKGLM